MLGHLSAYNSSVPRREQFSVSVAENCEVRGTENVPGQI